MFGLFEFVSVDFWPIFSVRFSLAKNWDKRPKDETASEGAFSRSNLKIAKFIVVIFWQNAVLFSAKQLVILDLSYIFN